MYVKNTCDGEVIVLVPLIVIHWPLELAYVLLFVGKLAAVEKYADNRLVLTESVWEHPPGRFGTDNTVPE